MKYAREFFEKWSVFTEYELFTEYSYLQNKLFCDLLVYFVATKQVKGFKTILAKFIR